MSVVRGIELVEVLQATLGDWKESWYLRIHSGEEEWLATRKPVLKKAETPSLAVAAAEIQKLLKQLEASNPIATETEQTAFLTAMISPTHRQRFIGALQSAGSAALDEIPYGAVLKALVEGWKDPNV